ncbi:MAG: hypothetical protein ACR2FM_01945 [Candidatus Saccharimonadales bacterium]
MNGKLMHDESGYGVLLEQIIHQNDVLLENMGEMRDSVRLIPSIIIRLTTIEQAVDTLTFAVTETNRELRLTNTTVANHEDRITVLEQPT